MSTQFDSIISWRGSTVALYTHVDYYVYTVHFKTPLAHGDQAPTLHYTGMASDVDARLARHRRGDGSRLMAVVAERGISWELAQLIPCESYSEAHALEARLKKHSASRRCPVCQQREKDVFVSLREGHWPIALHNQVGRRRPMTGRWSPGRESS